MTFASAARWRAILFLCGAASGALCSPGTAAQAIAAAPATSPDLDPNRREPPEDIVVEGARAAIKDAQELQIRAASFATVVSGDELRAQPQQNLADLLTRLPGISSSVDQSRNAAGTGEAQYVSIRGLDTAYNAYSLDGVRLAQTDARTRAISMNLLSPFALATVHVDKAPTARFDGDAIAGLIDLVTMTGFDGPASHVQLRARGLVSGRAAARDQKPLGSMAQMEVARRSGAFGIYASAYYGVKNTLGESTAMQHDWEKYDGSVSGRIRDQLDNLFPRGAQWQAFRNRIERLGGTLNLDYRGSDSDYYWHTTFGRYALKSWMDQTALRQTSLAADQINPNPDNGAYDASGHRADYGLTATDYFRTEHSNQQLLSSKIGGETRAGEMTIDYHAAYSRGEQDYPLRIQSGFAGRPYIGTTDDAGLATYRMVTDISDRTRPQVVLSEAARAALIDPSSLRQWYVTQQFESAWERRVEGQVDATWHLADQGLTALAAGAKVEDATRSSNDLGDDDALLYYFPKSDGTPSPRYAATGPAVTALPGRFLSGFMHDGAQVPIYLIDPRVIERQVAQLSTPKLATIDPARLKEDRLNGQEDRIGAYLTATLRLADVELIPGLRYEDNRFRGTYWQDQGHRGALATSTRRYDQWLPSLIVNYRPAEREVVRASVRKSYSRPAFDLLLGPTRVSRNDLGQVTGLFIPNPDLDAQQAWNADVSFELQGDRTDFLSLSPYYKRLRHVLFSTGSTNAGGDLNLWGESQPAQQGGVEVSRLSTDATGDIYGVELFARYSLRKLPDWLDGLGVQAGATLQRAKAQVLVDGQRRDQRLPQAPRAIYNAELFYARGPFNAAVNYNYTSDRLYDLRSSRPDTYVQPTTKANVILGYALPSGLTIGASVENLFDEHILWATTSERKEYLSNDRKGGYVETGRVYLLDLSYRL